MSDRLVVPFRLYGLAGCPHCEEAARFLQSAKVPAQLVLIANDPIVAEGILRVTASEVVTAPIMVYGVPDIPEVIVGFKKEDYQRVVDDFHSKFVPGAPNLPAPEGQRIRAVVDEATASSPKVGGVANVSSVSGSVDNVGGPGAPGVSASS